MFALASGAVTQQALIGFGGAQGVAPDEAKGVVRPKLATRKWLELTQTGNYNA